MSKIVVINEKEIEIKKLPLKKYADVLSAFQNLPKHLDLFKGKNENELASALPEIVTVAYPDVVSVVNIVTGVSKEEIDEWGLDDLVKVVEAFMEVNNYSEIYSVLKKVLARPRTSQEVVLPPTGSTQP